jgi:hypothetical protein
MAIMGFGGGALIASPLSRQLMSFYDPAYDGTAGTVPNGRAVAEGKVLASGGRADLSAQLPLSPLRR